MMLGYSFLLALAVVVSSPWWLARMLITDRYREGMAQRLGRVPVELREGVRGKRVMWLHAVSVGEVLAATRLVAELEEALGNDWRIVISTTTRTGQALAKKRFGPERVFYMPLDFAFAMRAYLRVLRPQAVVLMESELWPRLLHECCHRKIPVAVANARISDRSFRRAMKVRRLWSRVLRMPTLYLAQSEQDAQRLTTLLGPIPRATPNRRHPEEQSDERPPHFLPSAPAISVSGNLKYDVRAPKQSHVAELIRQVAAGRPIIVAGSTVGNDSSEDSWLIRSFDLRPGSDAPLLVLAPRHPEKFDIVYSMAMEYPTLRATELLAGKTHKDGFSVPLREGERAQSNIVVLDTIGDLAAVYSIATIAFVGGSLVARGGHNPLEPAQFGVPITMGRSYENFRDIVDTMREARAIRIVQGGYEMGEAFRELLSDPEAARAMGERGRAVFESQQGATARTVAAILGMMETRA